MPRLMGRGPPGPWLLSASLKIDTLGKANQFARRVREAFDVPHPHILLNINPDKPELRFEHLLQYLRDRKELGLVHPELTPKRSLCNSATRFATK